MTHIAVTEVDRRSAVPVYIGIGHDNGIQVAVIDTLDGEVDVVRQLGIKCQRSLPSLRHAQIFAQDGGRTRDRGRAGSIDLLQHIALTHGETGQRSAVGLSSPIGGLTHTRVTDCGNEPYERHAAYEETCTSTEDVLTLTGGIPVETDTRREAKACIGHVVGTEMTATEIDFIVVVIVIILQRWIRGQLKTGTD